jgi:hypothetical protein
MDPPDTRVWRDVPPLASSPRIITQKPWSRRGTIGKNGRWICGRSAAPTGSASPASRASSKSGEMLAFAHIPTGPANKGELIIDDSKNHTRPAERTNGVHSNHLTPKAPYKPALAKAGDPTPLSDLEALVEPTTRGDPESPLRWTCKSVRRLAQALQAQGHEVSRILVGHLLCKATAKPRRATATPTGMRSSATSTPK